MVTQAHLRASNLFVYLKNDSSEVASSTAGERLAELQGYEPPEYILRSDDQSRLIDSLANELLDTRAMKRLRGIGFLGAIDYTTKGSGRSAYRRRHSRLEHSIGVALLAQRFCKAAEVSERERLTLVAASLLHDVGHGPLSHTLEPVFADYFGIDHHKATQEILKGDGPFGSEIAEAIRRHRVDLDEVIALIDGEHNGKYGYLFSGRINLDTLEGISRCRAIFGPRAAFGTSLPMVERWARSGEGRLPQEDFDEFWTLKHHVYAWLINSHIGLTMDTVSQAWAVENIASLSRQSFYMTERQMRESHPELFSIIKYAAFDRLSLHKELPKSWLEARVRARRRTYFVDETINLSSVSDIKKRYQHSKESWMVSLDEVLGNMRSEGQNERTR